MISKIPLEISVKEERKGLYNKVYFQIYWKLFVLRLLQLWKIIESVGG